MSTTIPATSKDELLARVSAGYRGLRAALEALPRERFEEETAAGWTLKDVVAHLAAWEETVPPRVAGVREKGSDPRLYDDVESFNARVAEAARDRTADELFARWAAAHVRVLDTLRALPENAAPLALEIVEWNTTGHYPDHYADVGAAIRDAADLVRVVQTSWIPFRLAHVALGVPALDRTTSAGWTYKDLAAHAAAWEDRTASRLRAFRESGERSAVDDTDEFNAAVVERTRGRDAREVLRELGAAHERLIAEIERLSPAQLHASADWAIAIVAGNTYGHYAEHHDEVFAEVPKRPSELLERMREGWQPFRRAVTELGTTALERPTPSGWTYKGMLSHAANWMEHLRAELPTRLEGRRGPLPDVDGENRREAEAAATRSPRQVLDRLDAAYRGVEDAVGALPADRDVHFMAVRLVAGETYGHFLEHLPELEQARPSSVPRLLATVDADWQAVRDAVRGLGRAGLERDAGHGWTFKDLVGHLAAWEEYAVAKLEERRAGGLAEPWPEDEDAFNAREIANRKLVGPEAILDELDTAHRRLREAVAALTDDDLRDPHVFQLVAGNSYAHYAQHAAELARA